MTKPFDMRQLQFFITLPAPCPYLPGEQERKLFTPLGAFDAPYINDHLTHSGFRRSQNVVYRPACDTCSACRSLRVNVRQFKPSRSQRRVLRRNQDLHRTECGAIASDEQFDLLQRYLNARHYDGGMADLDFDRYAMMVDDCASETSITEYRLGGKLAACCITDYLRDGLSMVYSFFDPDLEKRSLGNYMVLDHIDMAAGYGGNYIYLGYWVKNSQKMAYKSLFEPHELLSDRGWVPVLPKRNSNIPQ